MSKRWAISIVVMVLTACAGLILASHFASHSVASGERCDSIFPDQEQDPEKTGGGGIWPFSKSEVSDKKLRASREAKESYLAAIAEQEKQDKILVDSYQLAKAENGTIDLRIDCVMRRATSFCIVKNERDEKVFISVCHNAGVTSIPYSDALLRRIADLNPTLIRGERFLSKKQVEL